MHVYNEMKGCLRENWNLWNRLIHFQELNISKTTTFKRKKRGGFSQCLKYFIIQQGLLGIWVRSDILYVHCLESGCTSLTTKRFPKRCSEVEAWETSKGRREISRSGGMYIVHCTPDTSRFEAVYAVRPFSHHQSMPRDVSGSTFLGQLVLAVLKSTLPC